MSVHQLPDGRWICKFPAGTLADQPKKTKEYFGRGEEGRIAAERRNKELGVGQGIKKKVASPLFSELADQYLSEHILLNAAKSTSSNLDYKISRVIIPLLGHLQANQIDHDALNRFVLTRQQQGVKNRTIRDDLVYIRTILNYAVKMRLIVSHRASGYRLPRDDSDRIKPPNKAEFEAIISHAAPHVKRAMWICYFTGARPGPVEVFSLKWDAVDFYNQTITIKSAEKGGIEQREIPLAPKFMDLLKSWREEDEQAGNKHPYIVHYGGGPIKSIKRGFEYAKRKAGITRRIRPYDLRHMTASELLAGGVDIKTVSEILGNTPEQCMRAYLHVRTEQKRNAVDKL